MKKNYEDKDSTNKPRLKCLFDKEYLIQLDTDEPDSTFVCQLLKLSILHQLQVAVRSRQRSTKFNQARSLC